MLEQLENGNFKDPTSGNLSPDAASVKMGGADNSAYGGFPQSDDPKVLKQEGEQKLTEESRGKMASHLLGVWQKAVDDKQTNLVDQDLLACLRQFRGQYDEAEEQQLRLRGFPLVYFPLSEHKVHTAIAWIDEFFTNGETLVNVKPTPLPEMEESVVMRTVSDGANDIASAIQQTGVMPQPEMVYKYAQLLRRIVEQEVDDEAGEKAVRMERTLRDDMLQGGWKEKIHELIGLTSVYGTGGFRSPIIRHEPRMTWKGDKVVYRDCVTRGFEAISPFDMFPAPGAVDTQHGDFCLRVRYNPMELAHFRKKPSWDEKSVNEVLARYGVGGLRLDVSSDAERRMLTGQRSSDYGTDTMEGFEFWGGVSGEMLHEIGVTKDAQGGRIENTAWDWYQVNAIVIGEKVVYCRVMEDGEDRPVDAVKFYDTPGSFWGRGVLQKIRALQKICNAAGRSLVTNMGFASGPQGIVDLNMIAPGDDMKARPWKIWTVRRNAMNQGQGRPIEFFNIDSHAKELMEVFDYFQREADELTGIPAYANGTDAATGAARTATGLNLLMGQANRGVKKVIGNFDELVRQSVHRLYRWHMKYNPDNSIKGDVEIEVTGLRYFVTKTSRAMDILNLVDRVTQNPALSQIPGAKRLCDLLHEVGIAMDLGPYALAPSSEELKRQQEEARQQMMQQQMAQADAQRMAAEQNVEMKGAEAEAVARAKAQYEEPQQDDGLTPTGRPQYADRPGRDEGGEQ